MEILDAYQVVGWLEFAISLFAAVPVGFMLGCFLGLLSFGTFKLIGLIRSLV